MKTETLKRITPVLFATAMIASIVVAENQRGPSDLSYELPEKIAMPARPSAAGAPVEKKSCVIIDFSGDFGHKGFPKLGGGRPKSLLGKIERQDLEGDGQKNDSIDYYAFSMEYPFNPAPSGYHLHDAHNSVFYGGGVGYFYNRGPRLSECCINMDWSDTVSFNAYAPNKGTGLRVFATWLWKKEDFVNRGDECAVSFDDESMMYVHITRYWKDYQDGRFVVQQDGQFYLSEYRFGGLPSTHRSGAPNNAKVYSVCPAKTRWAKWQPEAPYHLEYEPSELVYEEVIFTDVESVGWISARYKNDGPASCWLKWAGFDVHATVTRPWRPSEHLNMTKVAGDDFYISETEIDFRTWRKISNWSYKQVWAHMPSYVYDRKGDIGSMDLGQFEHSVNEPVTDITWADAAAWCNALSEYEGLTPCYYSDKEHSKIFRHVRDRLSKENPAARPSIYVDWAAGGYRLPSQSEWTLAAKQAEATPQKSAQERTHEVDSKRAGLHDMVGNVWEYIWDVDGDQFDPETQTHRLVLGGGFRYPVDVSRSAGLAVGEKPGDGQYNIGFRVVRYVDGGKKPRLTAAPSTSGFSKKTIPEWRFAVDEQIGKSDTKPTLDLSTQMVNVPEGSFAYGRGRVETSLSAFEFGKNEVTYALWNDVYHWAVMNGYEFNYNGDMGSMRSQTGSFSYSPNEPVTLLNFSDVLIWCNALSEITGKTPVYYSDTARTNLLKKSIQYRWAIGERDRSRKTKDWLENRLPNHVSVKWSADGYRLPTEVEREYAYQNFPGKKSASTLPSKGSNDYWLWVNSGGKTQPVGTSVPNQLGIYDLLGNVSERYWSKGVHLEDTQDPRSDIFKSSLAGGSFYIQPKDNFSYYLFSTKKFGMHHAYPDVGFRLARSEAGILEDIKDRTPKAVLDFDPKTVDPLQGQMYRANNRLNGHFKTKGLPTLTGVKWKFKTGKGVGASPVVVEGTVYVGSLDGNFYAIDAESGKEKWRFATRENAPIRSSAIVFNKKVFFVGNDRMLYALHIADGTVAWKAPSALTGGRDYDIGPTPTLVAGVVFCDGQKDMTGFDAETGKIRWVAKGLKSGRGTFAQSYHPAGVLISGGGSAYPSAIDLRIAKSRGRCGGSAGDTYQLTAACDDEHYYIAIGKGAQKIAILDKANKGDAGKVLFSYKETHWNEMHPYFSPVGVDNKNMYFGNIDKHLYAIDKKTGKRSWRFETGEAVRSGPSIAAGVVYFGSEDGCLYAVDAQSGKKRWKFETGGKITHSSPWLGDGMVYIGSSDGFIYALH